MPKAGSVQVVPANYISVVRRKHMDLYLRVQHLLPLFKVYRVSSTGLIDNLRNKKLNSGD